MAGESAPKRRRSTGEDYSKLFDRIEQTFDVSELTPDVIADYINAKTPGMIGLAEQIAQVGVIDEDIDRIEDISELRELRKDAIKLPIYRQDILTKITEKIIALSITAGETFAKERGITLTEKIVANVENWKDGRIVLTIRERGSFKSYKIIGKTQ